MKVPPDGIFFEEINCYMDGTGQTIRAIHTEDQCEDRPCVIHNPSNHAMRSFKTHFRGDKHQMERICDCGTGHPDPDDMVYQKSIGLGHLSVHGCDGCCRVAYQPKFCTNCGRGVNDPGMGCLVCDPVPAPTGAQLLDFANVFVDRP